MIGIVTIGLDCNCKMDHPLHSEFGRSYYVSKLFLGPERIEHGLFEKSYQYLTSLRMIFTWRYGLSLPDAPAGGVGVLSHRIVVVETVDCPVSQFHASIVSLSVLFTDPPVLESTLCCLDYLQGLLLIQMASYQPHHLEVFKEIAFQRQEELEIHILYCIEELFVSPLLA